MRSNGPNRPAVAAVPDPEAVEVEVTADEDEVFLSGEEDDAAAAEEDEAPMERGRGPDADPPEPRRFGEAVVVADDMRALTGEAGFGSVPDVVVVGMRLLNHPPIRFPEGGG